MTGFYIPSWNFIPVNDEDMSKLLFQIAGKSRDDGAPARKRPREEDSDLPITTTGDLLTPSDYEDTPLEVRRTSVDVAKVKSAQRESQKKVLADLDAFVARIKNGYLNNPCVYKDAFEDFVHQTKKFKTDAELVCALYTFGE